MIYEWRVYDTIPGRLPALHKRFREHTVKLFAKHGFKQVGYWEELVGQSNRLVYLLAFEDLGDRQKKWDAFLNDPEWIEARNHSEKDGPINALVSNRILKPTDYSALQ